MKLLLRSNFFSFPQYFQNISNFRSQITYSFVKCGASIIFSSVLQIWYVDLSEPVLWWLTLQTQESIWAHDKTNTMACTPSEDWDQLGHPPSLIRVFAVSMKKAWVLSYHDLSLRWAHMHFCWFCHEMARTRIMHSWLSLYRLRLTRITAYLGVKIWSLFSARNSCKR